MAYVVFDRIKETTTTAGTGALTLAGAMAGFTRFGAVMAVGDSCDYVIEDVQAGTWEVGFGTYSAPNTLSRITVYASSAGGAAVSLAGNPASVFITVPAARINALAPKDSPTFSGPVTLGNGGQGPINIGGSGSYFGSNVAYSSGAFRYIASDYAWWVRSDGSTGISFHAGPSGTAGAAIGDTVAWQVSPGGVFTLPVNPLGLSSGGTGANTAAGARSALGLGSAATLGVGTAPGTVAAGDDARITGALSASAAAAAYAPKDSPNFTGSSFSFGAASTASGMQFEIGSTTTANYLYFDLHSSGTNSDFDVRIDVSGGSATSGQGAYGISAATFKFNGYNVLTDKAAIPLAGGGTGATTAAGARTALGLATVASSGAYGDLLNPPAIPAPSNAAPLADGTATAGASAAYAREGHVHPTDTSRAAASNPTFAASATLSSGGQTRWISQATSGGTDAKLSDHYTDGTAWIFRFLNDAGTAANNWLSVVRSGYTAASVTLSAANIQLNGTLGLSAPLAVAQGGTGATTAAGARSALGLAAVAATGAYGDLLNPPAIPAPSNAAPLADGTPAAGSSAAYAREGHVHPTDTSRVAKSGDTMSGPLTVQAAGTVNSLGVLSTPSATQWQTQGAYIGWNFTQGGGETSFINSKGLAAGGFAWYNTASSAGSVPTLLMTLNGSGVLALTAPLAIGSGGTGGTTAAAALANLGALSTAAAASTYALINNPNFTGNTFVYGAASTGASCGEEFGSLSTAQTLFRDWHSSGYSNDYDVREAVAGGVNGTSGKGAYSITCASYTMYGCGPVIYVGTDFIAKRIVSGNFGVAEYCDGASYYHLITTSGQQTANTFSGLRPFYYNLTTGLVGFDNGIAPSDINMAGSGNLAGAWNSFQATVSASTGAITTAAGTVRWKKLGRTVFFNLYATVSNNGNGSGQLSVSLPFANNGSSPLMLISRDLNSLALLSGYIGVSGTSMAINRVSDNGYPVAANGAAGFAFSGCYEAAA